MGGLAECECACVVTTLLSRTEGTCTQQQALFCLAGGVPSDGKNADVPRLRRQLAFGWRVVGCGLWAVTLSLDSRLRTDDVVFGNSGADPDRRKEAKARARNEKRENEKESL